MIIFKCIKAIFTWISMVIAYMIGGQGKVGDKEVGKGPRRFGVPGIVILSSMGKRFKLKHLVFLLWIPILSMGYGEDSFLLNLVKFDFLARIIYGGLLSIPFVVFGVRRWLFGLICLIVAFSVRAGSLGQIAGMDILIEDIIRGGVLAGLVIVNIFWLGDK